MSAPAIAIAGLRKSFGAHPALAGVDLEIPAGVVSGLLGPNGAGKTTLFSIVAGFLRADAGSIRILGHDHRDVAALRGRIGVLPQDAAFQADLSILDQMVYLLRLAGRSQAQAAAEVAATLERVGLGDYLARRTGELSHGMYKRLSLAQAFLGEPEVVLLDEPTAGLDPGNAQRIRALIRDFTADGRRTVVVSSHDMVEMQALCAHVAILRQGRLVSCGRVEDLCRDRRLLQIRLARPPAAAECEALRALPAVLAAELRPDGVLVLQVADGGDELDLGLQRWFVERGILIRAWQDGRTLAEHFHAVTTAPAAPAGSPPGTPDPPR
jgi:ABC-type multidrug transport system ATPase subunit